MEVFFNIYIDGVKFMLLKNKFSTRGYQWKMQSGLVGFIMDIPEIT